MDDALRPVNSDRRQSVSIELILPWEMRLPVVTDFVTLLADSRGTGPGMRLGWSGMTLAIDGRADVQKGRHVLRGGGPVACVMPVVTEFVTLLLADFVTL